MDRSDLLFAAGLFVSVFLPMTIAFFASGKQWKAEQDRAHARRLADARMNARLLRFNI